MGKSLKGKELGSGLSQRKDGRYQAKYYIPGSPKPKYLYDRNLAKLKKKRDLEKAKYILGYNDKAKKYKVSEWFDVWMKLYKIGRIKANTVRGYVDGFERGADFIGSVRLDCLTPSHIYNMVEGMQSDGYAESSVVHTLSIVKQLLQSAVDNQMIPMNPCKGIAIEKSEKVTVDPILENESKILQPEEIKTFLDAAKNTRYYELFYIILNTGMRIGEITALCWSDIDFENGLVKINKSVLYSADKGVYEDTTKTNSSNRIISIPSAMVQLLKEYKIEQSKKKLLMGDMWNNSGKVFTSESGGMINPDTLSTWFKGFINRHNLPDIHYHSLRHTAATLLIAGGVDIATVSKRLGHADRTTTLNIYTHAIKSADKAAADKLQDIFTHSKIG